jgi:8-oxo-dGTP diphosphatase
MLSILEKRLASGLKLLQIREPDFDGRDAFVRAAIALAHRHGAKVMTKAPDAAADGVHFTAAQLMALKDRPKRGLAAASCHTREELERAMQLGMDFAVLGPVNDKGAIGWERFTALAQDSGIPVYAIGGLSPSDLQQARRAGAHGLAMIRGSWV